MAIDILLHTSVDGYMYVAMAIIIIALHPLLWVSASTTRDQLLFLASCVTCII